jgi:predicted nucleic acid-binding protein
MQGRTSSPDPQDDNTPIVLIDNNMIQHFLGKETGKHLEPILKELVDVGATLAASQIVVYEALKAIVFNETKLKGVVNFFENYLVRYPVNEDVLIESARVHEIYGSDKDTKGHRDKFSTEDIIIATTAMMLGAYILTCDANDFPIPFFKEANRQYIYYEEKNRRKHLIVYLLHPDPEAIGAALEKLKPTIKHKDKKDG